MTVRKSASRVISFAASVLLAQEARAVDAVYVPSYSYYSFQGGQLEVQGFSGRFDLPLTIQPSKSLFPFIFGAVAGSAANSSNLFTLINDRQNSSDNSVLVTSDAQTGALIGQIQLGARFSDIAYTNGQLYGVLSTSSSLAIDSISNSGSLQPVLNASEPAFNGSWLLSGVVAGNQLIATENPATPSISTNVAGFVVKPSAPSNPSQINVYSSFGATPFISTVFSADGHTITTVGSSSYQEATSLPSDTDAGPRPLSMEFGASSSRLVSDEFSYPYASSNSAYVTLGTSFDLNGTDGLYRLPQQLYSIETVQLSNGVAPDGASLSNVTGSHFEQQTGGPSPVTITEQDAPPGSFSQRTLGVVTMSINLANAQRGLYTFALNPTITANYSYNATVDENRAIPYPSHFAGEFGYDPVSSNIVGNGDASMGPVGWEERFGDTGEWYSEIESVGPKGFLIPSAVLESSGLRQLLQLPTPNQPMTLSFQAQLDVGSSSPVELQVDLNGERVDDVYVSSASAQTYSVEITDPALQNISNAALAFDLPYQPQASSPVDVDNISLTAVPEPVGAVSLPGLVSWLLCRRRTRR
jgi:hypothetical protein